MRQSETSPLIRDRLERFIFAQIVLFERLHSNLEVFLKEKCHLRGFSSKLEEQSFSPLPITVSWEEKDKRKEAAQKSYPRR